MSAVDPLAPSPPPLRVGRPIVLVGMMGAGKTSVGRRLAAALGLPFHDADEEIERAAGLSVTDIFQRHGEAEFRRGERSVIKRLLDGPPHVLATGGGAFMDEATRAIIRERAISVWLKANLDVLMKRVQKRPTRPLLQVADPRAELARLLALREPVYAEADVAVESSQGPQSATVRAVVQALTPFRSRWPGAAMRCGAGMGPWPTSARFARPSPRAGGPLWSPIRMSGRCMAPTWSPGLRPPGSRRSGLKSRRVRPARAGKALRAFVRGWRPSAPSAAT
jgi:shikimate kinase